MVMLLFGWGSYHQLAKDQIMSSIPIDALPIHHISVIRMGTTRSQESSGLNRMTMAQTKHYHQELYVTL